MLKNAIYLLILLSGILFFAGCNSCSNSKPNDEDDFDSVSDSSEVVPLQVGEDIMGSMIQNISSPVEMANIIKASGVDFSQKILNNPDNVSKYETSFKKALNFGVFSADLGYINIFDKNNIVISYLMAVKKLADEIKVGQFFDYDALSKAAQNSNNLEALMQMSISSFNKIDAYLRGQNRSDVSTLIVTGTWFEGMYLYAKVYKEAKSKEKKEMSDRIAEQKNIVEILEIVLDNYKSLPNFPTLVEGLNRLTQAYDAIKLTTEYVKSEPKEVNGSLLIIQKEVTTAHYTEEDINRINDIIIDIRTKMVE